MLWCHHTLPVSRCGVLVKPWARVRGDALVALRQATWLVVVSLFGHGDGEEPTMGVVLAALRLWQLLDRFSEG